MHVEIHSIRIVQRTSLEFTSFCDFFKNENEFQQRLFGVLKQHHQRQQSEREKSGAESHVSNQEAHQVRPEKEPEKHLQEKPSAYLFHGRRNPRQFRQRNFGKRNFRRNRHL